MIKYQFNIDFDLNEDVRHTFTNDNLVTKILVDGFNVKLCTELLKQKARIEEEVKGFVEVYTVRRPKPFMTWLLFEVSAKLQINDRTDVSKYAYKKHG